MSIYIWTSSFVDELDGLKFSDRCLDFSHNLAIRTHRLVLDTPDDVGAITRQHQVMQKQILSQDQAFPACKDLQCFWVWYISQDHQKSSHEQTSWVTSNRSHRTCARVFGHCCVDIYLRLPKRGGRYLGTTEALTCLQKHGTFSAQTQCLDLPNCLVGPGGRQP